MSFIRFIGLSVLFLAGVIPASFAQAVPVTPAAVPASDSDSTEDVVNGQNGPVLKGIRFVCKEIPAGYKGELYMPINKKDTAKVPLIMGLLGQRVPFPENGKIEFYEEEPKAGKPQGKSLLSVPLPNGASDRMIGVLVPTEAGWGIFFMSERDIKISTVIFKNLTNQPAQIVLDENKFITLPPGGSEVFDPGRQDKTNTHAGKLCFKNEKEQWYVSRQFSIQVRRLDSEMLLIVWNPRINRPDIQKIVIAPEQVFKPKAVAPGDRIPKRGAGGKPIPPPEYVPHVNRGTPK